MREKRTVALHVDCERRVWHDAADVLDTYVNSVGFAVSLRRALRFDQSRSLAAHAYARRPTRMPPAAFWQTTEGLEMTHLLSRGDYKKHLWVNLRWQRALVPYLRPSLRDLVRTFSTEDPRRLSVAQSRTCVVHYRMGDFQLETTQEDFGERRGPRGRRRTLRGGARTSSCLTAASRRTFATTSLERPLHQRATAATSRTIGPRCDGLPEATFARVTGTAEEDFLRMANAAMLVVGGGSYATAAPSRAAAACACRVACSNSASSRTARGALGSP